MDNEYDITNTINMILTRYIDKEYYITNTINMILIRATPVRKTRTPVCNTSIQLYATPVYNTSPLKERPIYTLIGPKNRI